MKVGGGGGVACTCSCISIQVKGSCGGGGGWVSAMLLFFAKMVVRHYQPPSQLFLIFCFDHISHEFL